MVPKLQLCLVPTDISWPESYSARLLWDQKIGLWDMDDSINWLPWNCFLCIICCLEMLHILKFTSSHADWAHIRCLEGWRLWVPLLGNIFRSLQKFPWWVLEPTELKARDIRNYACAIFLHGCRYYELTFFLIDCHQK